ncbi:hypothetical protein PWT90_03442 [Aphanocladium album]|nr:hypothetical protein PWT90_03442 [Aphanocladium album]
MAQGAKNESDPPHLALESQGGSDAPKQAKHTSPYLPPEIFLNIGKLLRWQELYSLVQTCKKIKQTLEEYLYQRHGEQLLIWAASKDDVLLAQDIIQRKKSIDVNFIESGSTALALAFKNANPAVATLLLQQKGINISDKTNGINLLETAILKGCCPLVDQILKYRMAACKTAIEILQRSYIQFTTAPHLREGSLWLPQGWDARAIHCNTRSFTNGQSPLITAARCGNEDILHSLICSDVDVNQQSGHITDLGSTVKSAHSESSEGYRWTALTMAAWHGHENVVRRLLKCEAIDTTSVSLRSVARRIRPQRNGPISVYTLRMSIQLRIDSEDATEEGDALFWAVKQGHSGCVLALLQSCRVTPTAEAIATLRRLNDSQQGANSAIGCMLDRCESANSVEARVARFSNAKASAFTIFGEWLRKSPRRGRRT